MNSALIENLVSIEANLEPCLIIRNDVVHHVNHSFLQLCAFSEKDIQGKNFSYVWNELLRIYILEEALDTAALKTLECYLFTKDNCVCQVLVSVNKVSPTDIEYKFTKLHNNILDDTFSLIEELNRGNGVAVALFSVPEYIQLKANENYFSILKKYFYISEKTIGMSMSQFMPNWEISRSKKIWDNTVVNDKTFYSSVYKLNRPEVKNVYMDYTITPIKENKKVKYLLLKMKDISEILKNKRMLEEKNRIVEQNGRLFEAVIENISDGLIIMTKDKKFTRVNKAVRNLFPVPLGNDRLLPPVSPVEFLSDSGDSLMFDELPIFKVLDGKRICNEHISVKHPDKTFHLSINGIPIYDSDGSLMAGIVCTHDITDQLNREQVILEQKEKLEAIIENMSDGVFLMGQDGTVKMFNQEAKSFLYDLSSYKKLGADLKDTRYYDNNGNRLTPKDLPVQRILTGERIKSMRLTAAHPQKTAYYTFSGCPIYDSEGNINAALVCFSDITEQVENDEKIKTQQRAQIILEKIERENLEKVIKMKDEFLSIVSHEFKTPLTIIDAAAQSIERIYYNEASPKVKDLVGKIHQNSFRLLRLVNNLLDITRFDADQIRMHKKNLDIVKLTRTIVESVGLYAVQKDIQLGFHSSMRSKTIAIDDEKYERIILNLLSNAVKFTPRGKSVSVRVYCDKKYVYTEVKDDGVGIPKDKQKLIFERFGQVDSSLTRQAEGTGLGLTIVKALVAKFNGEISVKSDCGKGSTFTVALPISKVKKSNITSSLVNLADNCINKDVDVEFSDVYFD